MSEELVISEKRVGFEGWLLKNRTLLAFGFFLLLAIIGLKFYFSLSQKSEKDRAWDLLLETTQNPVNVDAVEVASFIQGSSAEPWMILRAFTEAIDRGDFELAKLHLQSLAQLKAGSLDTFGALLGSEVAQADLVEGLQKRIQLFLEWKEKYPGYFDNPAPDPSPTIVLVTDLGEIRIGLYQSEAPISTQKFISYCIDGFYVGKAVNEIVPGRHWGIGSAVEQTESGDPAEEIPSEPKAHEEAIPCEKTELYHFAGSVSITAKSDDTECFPSQFLVILQDQFFMDGKRPVIGKIIGGMEVAKKIGEIESTWERVPNKPSFRKPNQLVTIKEVRVEN